MDRKRTEDVFVDDENVTFESLHLKPEVLKGLQMAGFRKPSPIQLRAIPFGCLGCDIIAQAKSGTGKTCVFTVVILQMLNLENLCPQALILAPTREIAIQIRDVFRKLGRYLIDLQVEAFIGGVAVSMDKQKLNMGCHIVVGTPGRINQLFELNAIPNQSIKCVVLDESDQLLTESYRLDIKNILVNHTLPSKQVMAFSASYYEEIEKEIAGYMREPTYILLNADEPSLKGVKQYFVICDEKNENKSKSDNEKEEKILMQKNKKDNNNNNNNNNDPLQSLHSILSQKIDVLITVLQKIPFHQCIVFSNEKHRARDIADTLVRFGWPATSISADQTQEERTLALNKLRNFKIRILVSSDLTSRGIDVERINVVINLDIPYNAETYLHRVGRTGRFGSLGVAITLVNGNEKLELDNFVKTLNSSISPLPDQLSPDYFSNNTLEKKEDQEAFEKMEKTRLDTQEKLPKNPQNVLPTPSELIQSYQRTASAVHDKNTTQASINKKNILKNNKKEKKKNEKNKKNEKLSMNKKSSKSKGSIQNPSSKQNNNNNIATNAEEIQENVIPNHTNPPSSSYYDYSGYYSGHYPGYYHPFTNQYTPPMTTYTDHRNTFLPSFSMDPYELQELIAQAHRAARAFHALYG